MPKEVAHILFADAVASRLVGAGGAWLGGLLTATRGTYHGGALATDTFYYTVRLQGLPVNAAPWGEMVHGEDGEDTAASVIEMLRRLKATGEGAPHFAEQVAFACGFITHMALDMTLHPWVYALSGQYYDPNRTERSRAVTRHRLIETWLDLQLLRRLGSRPERFAPLIAAARSSPGLRVSLGLWADCFAQVHGIEVPVIKRLMRDHHLHMTLLRLFRAPRVARLIRRLDKALNHRLDSFAALFYPAADRVPRLDFLEQTGFVHPATGLFQDDGVDSLWQAAIERAVGFLVAVDRYMAQDSDLAELTQRVSGYSLSMGLPGFVTANAAYFQPLDLEELRP